MHLDASLPSAMLGQVPALAQAAEAMGFDGLWTSEIQHDPFLPLTLAAEHTRQIALGTAVAIAFARSPTVLAHTAWDLAAQSGGRFILGLGTQVRAHVERRFGMPWPASPVRALREHVQVIRSVWDAWQLGGRPNVRGEYYKVTLMTPFFDPGPIPQPEIPIYVAGVNAGLARLAGEVADGFVVHPYHSLRYLQEVIQPAITQGAAGAGRSPQAIALSVTAFAVTNQEERQLARSQIAFYASTPTYRPVMALHGWAETADQLRALSQRGAWGEMSECITQEMLSTFAVVSSESDLPDALAERYAGIADRLGLYLPFTPGTRDAFWQRLISRMRAAGC
ncbi:MAG: TIGR03617 family F420-dependent LLM class oxidoreductase [Anaerolineales bacterium]|nr:TIGR03617 family F420-dependent LLM class oxidoreductase [Anaerolineales bacterium]